MTSLLVFVLFVAAAFAGDLEVRSAGAPVVVMRAGQVAGTTPFTLAGLPGGPVELGFRDAPLGATLFTQKVDVPATGLLVLQVDLPERVASVVPASATPPVAPGSWPPAPASTGAPAPTASASPAAPTGDVYVATPTPGASIWLDGTLMGSATPAMLRAVPVGTHEVEVRTDCGRAKAAVVVANGVIVRTELAPVDGSGSLAITGTPVGAKVLLDGLDVGKLPLTADVSCGEHTLAVRADGFLEDLRTLRVPAFESTALAVTLRKEEFGTLVVDIMPLEAAVEVDGIDVGAGPRTIEKIAAGPHEVSGELPGFARQLQTVTIDPNQVARVNMQLVTEAAKKAKAPRAATGRSNVGRVVLNTAVSAVALGSSAYGVVRFLDADEAFNRYKTVPSDAAAERIYDEEVAPARTTAFVAGGVGIASLVTSGVLWFTTEF